MHSEPDRSSSKRRLPFEAIPKTISGYRVDGLLGQGATGIVLRVHDETLDRSMALKLLADNLDDDARARFMIEARAAGRIIHPNVVQVFGVGDYEGRTFITQELVDGHPLSDLLDVRGRLSPAAVIDIGVQAARGLERAAEVGVVHRDVKPQNLLVTEDGLVKLADFGLAKLLHAPKPLTDSGTTVGTPHYMSPEQGLAQDLDARSDQYSLGATLYHLVTGQTPFDSDNAVALVLKHVQESLPPVRSIRSEVPEALAAVIERMLAKSKEERFESFAEVVDALEAAGDEAADAAHEEVVAIVEETRKTTPVPALVPVAASVEVSVTSVEAVPAAAAPAGAPSTREYVLFGSLTVVALAVVVVAGFSAERKPARSVPAPAPAVAKKEPQSLPKLVAPVKAEQAAIVAEKDPVPSNTGPSNTGPSISRFGRLVQLLEDPKAAERAARELGELGDQRATPALIRVLEGSGTPGARAAAAEALGRLGDTRAIVPLEVAAERAKPESVREAAKQAQKRLFHVAEEDHAAE
jgi:predicted Ser/Thr protein kinase